MNNLDENVDLIKGLVKDKMRKYGDLLVNLYEKVKKGGALETTIQEKKVIFKMANKYGDLQGVVTPISQVDFSNIFNGIRNNVVIKQMVQWGGVRGEGHKGGFGIRRDKSTRETLLREYKLDKIDKLNNDNRYHKVGSKRLEPLYNDYIRHLTET